MLTVVSAGVLFYSSDSPQVTRFYPPCPVHALTGYDCPGCGTQRAVHQLLNGNIASAWHCNPLTLIAIPYATLGLLVQYQGNRHPSKLLQWLRKYLYGLWAALGWFVVVVAFTIVRNMATHV